MIDVTDDEKEIKQGKEDIVFIPLLFILRDPFVSNFVLER